MSYHRDAAPAVRLPAGPTNQVERCGSPSHGPGPFLPIMSPSQCIADCDAVITAATGRDTLTTVESDEMAARALACLRRFPDSEHAKLSCLEAFYTVLEASGCGFKPPLDHVSTVLSALRPRARLTSSVAAAALSALLQLFDWLGPPAVDRARSEGAVEAAAAALRAFPESAALHETGFTVLNWLYRNTRPTTALSLAGYGISAHDPSLRALISAGGVQTAIRALRQFPGAGMVSMGAMNALLALIQVDSQAAESASRGHAFKARRPASPRPLKRFDRAKDFCTMSRTGCGPCFRVRLQAVVDSMSAKQVQSVPAVQQSACACVEAFLARFPTAPSVPDAQAAATALVGALRGCPDNLDVQVRTVRGLDADWPRKQQSAWCAHCCRPGSLCSRHPVKAAQQGIATERFFPSFRVGFPEDRIRDTGNSRAHVSRD